MRMLHEIAQQRRTKVILVLDMGKEGFEQSLHQIDADAYPDVILKRDVDFFQWIHYYADCSGVITDSFHGTIFSIIFQKPFISKSNAKRGAERFVSLLEPIGLIDHLFSDFESMIEVSDLLQEEAINYQNVEEKLNVIRDKSLSWLKNALYSPKLIQNAPHCIFPVTMNASNTIFEKP